MPAPNKRFVASGGEVEYFFVYPLNFIVGLEKSSIFCKNIINENQTKKKIAEWLMDIAKYMLTAVLISSIFKDFEI